MIKKLILLEQTPTTTIGNNKPVTAFINHGDVSEIFPEFPALPGNGRIFDMVLNGQYVAFQVSTTLHSIVHNREVAYVYAYRLPYVDSLVNPLAAIDPNAFSKTQITYIDESSRNKISFSKNDLKPKKKIVTDA